MNLAGRDQKRFVGLRRQRRHPVAFDEDGAFDDVADLSPGCVCRPALTPGCSSAMVVTASRPGTDRSTCCSTVRLNPVCCAVTLAAMALNDSAMTMIVDGFTIVSSVDERADYTISIDIHDQAFGCVNRASRAVFGRHPLKWVAASC